MEESSRFAQIAVDMGFVTREELARAVELYEAAARRSRRTALLGVILVETGVMTAEQVLLVQRLVETSVETSVEESVEKSLEDTGPVEGDRPPADGGAAP